MPNNDDNDSTSKLGFRIGSEVRFTNRFFANHKLKYMDLGIGTVEGKKMPSGNDLPKLLVEFPFKHEFYTILELQRMVVTSRSRGTEVIVMIEVHPVYLEKVDKKHGKAK